MRMFPTGSVFEYLLPSWRYSLRRLRRCMQPWRKHVTGSSFEGLNIRVISSWLWVGFSVQLDAMLSHHDGLLLLWNHKPKQTPSTRCLHHCVISQQQKSNTQFSPKTEVLTKRTFTIRRTSKTAGKHKCFIITHKHL